MRYHLYIANGEQNTLSKFSMDASCGKLESDGDIKLDAKPGPLAVDRQERFLYASLRQTCQLYSYRIDGATGRLTLVNSVPVEADACNIRTDRTDRYLLSAYYSEGRVAVHTIRPDGSLGHEPIEWIATAEHAHCIRTDLSNRFAFVPHTNPANTISQFRFDQQTGHLTPNDPSNFHPSTPEGPRHICFHPNLTVSYSINENGSSVSAYQLNTQTGTLSALQTVSTLPDDFKADNTGAEIKITPSGKFLYASNRGHDSIACYRVDPTTGRLTALGHQPTEKRPRMFNLDPRGHFLFCAGEASGTLGSYQICQDTGQLKPMEIHDVGEGPWWVQFVAASG